jgi:agmatine deiminase
MEGGAFEVNGKGTILLVEAVTVARNRHLTKKEIEEDILQTLGQDKVIWLKEGLAEDPHQVKRMIGNYFGFGTGGHIDEFCRFANDSTILLCWVPENEKEHNLLNELNYNRMKTNFDILSKATDQDGKSFKIIKVPIPGVQIQKEKISQFTYEFLKNDYPDLTANDTLSWIAASSYLNYVITNGLVLLPAYWREGMNESVKSKDEEVLDIFEKQFPNREIVQINPTALNYYGGGMHCMTQQQPKLGD